MSREGENSNRNQAPQASRAEQEAKLGEEGWERGTPDQREGHGGDEIGLIGRGRRKAGERGESGKAAGGAEQPPAPHRSAVGPGWW